MLHRAVVPLGVLSVVALGCGKTDNRGSAGAADSASAVVAPTTATKVGETGGMKTPESVRYDPELDVFYISNINGDA
jgi:hypothetical protein